MQTINFSAGHTNAAEFCQVMYKCPSFPDVLKAYKNTQTTPPTFVEKVKETIQTLFKN